MSNYRISFTQPFEGRYTLKAISEDRKSKQVVGSALVIAPGVIRVATHSGSVVGIVANRKLAAKLIDEYHREHNRDAYWMWANHTLTV